MNSSEADRELIKRLDGLYLGQLEDEELESFNRCIKDSIAVREYKGVGGSLGLAKVRYRG